VARSARSGPTNVQAICYSPDGRLILSGSEDHTARLWDARSGALLRTLHHAAPVSAVAFAPDGRSLYTGTTTGSVKRWGADTPRTSTEAQRRSGMRLAEDMTLRPPTDPTKK
jgi:WD40 repeat protein